MATEREMPMIKMYISTAVDDDAVVDMAFILRTTQCTLQHTEVFNYEAASLRQTVHTKFNCN